MGWNAIVGERGHFVGMNGFGASAPYKELYQRFGITAEAIVETATNALPAPAAAKHTAR
jgi:transketolase